MNAEELYEIARINTTIKTLKHLDECKIEYIGDGLPCNCGLDELVNGYNKYVKKAMKNL